MAARLRDRGEALLVRADLFAGPRDHACVPCAVCRALLRCRMIEGVEQPLAGIRRDAARAKLRRDPFAADLVELVDGHQGLIVQRCRHAERVEHPAQEPAVVEPNHEVARTRALRARR